MANGDVFASRSKLLLALKGGGGADWISALFCFCFLYQLNSVIEGGGGSTSRLWYLFEIPNWKAKKDKQYFCLGRKSMMQIK